MTGDPAETNPELYRVVLENDRVRVLEYRDRPGDRTAPHRHPDTVMITLGSFSRRISTGGREVLVDLTAGEARWVAAQEHAGENVGDTPSHAFFVELKEPGSTAAAGSALGPAGS
ncbi:cupin domain-containing protein [Amycolatopsis sp. NPDC003865]